MLIITLFSVYIQNNIVLLHKSSKYPSNTRFSWSTRTKKGWILLFTHKMAIFSKFYFSHGKSLNFLENAWNHLKICRNDLWGILNNFLKQIFDFSQFYGLRRRAGGQKTQKKAIFSLSKVWKITKNQNF